MVDGNGTFPTVAILQATQVAAQKKELDVKRQLMAESRRPQQEEALKGFHASLRQDPRVHPPIPEASVHEYDAAIEAERQKRIAFAAARNEGRIPTSPGADRMARFVLTAGFLVGAALVASTVIRIGAVFAAEEAELFTAAMSSSPAFKAGVLTTIAYTEAKALSEGVPPGSMSPAGAMRPKPDTRSASAVAIPTMGGAKLYPNQSPQFLDDELAEAAAFGVEPRSGVGALGDLAGQRIKWAVTESGELVFIPHSPATGVEISHAVLSRGKPVQATGEAFITKADSGLVGDFISSYSGHFFKEKSAEAAAALPIGESAFKALGVTFGRRITP